MNRNYQKELDHLIDRLTETGKLPSLLLHSCCAPCSSYCLEYLSHYFQITVFYYNPNISSKIEYEKRAAEQKRLINALQIPKPYSITFLEGKYNPESFLTMAKGMENLPEGGERCFGCYELRERETAQVAKELGFDYFTTTLSISPHKNAEKLNEIGEALAKEVGIAYLPSDFKKKNGYKRSIELSKKYELYRQDYCGCSYSKKIGRENS